jgi:hypothetical protein
MKYQIDRKEIITRVLPNTRTEEVLKIYEKSFNEWGKRYIGFVHY